MQNTIFATIKKALFVSQKEIRSAAIEKSLGVTAPTEIQHLSVNEYSAVGGGPEVENEPER